jgi:hypothetical protein
MGLKNKYVTKILGKYGFSVSRMLVIHQDGEKYHPECE